MDNNTFEQMLCKHKPAIERFVYYRLPTKEDGDDVLQEVYLTAFQKHGSLKDVNAFKAWMLRIAKNKCNDYYRMCAKQLEIPFDEAVMGALTIGRYGISETGAVYDTLDRLENREKQILYQYYFKNMPQAEIAERLGIPLGTVKSRLHTAKQSFKIKYPYPPKSKGANIMKKMPDILPEYTLKKLNKAPFAVRWEEMMGWFIIPRVGEKIAWAMYDFPERTRKESVRAEVIGKAEVHGIEGVEIRCTQYEPMGYNSAGGPNEVERRFAAQLTDTHCRFLAESHIEHGVRKYFTFLDGDEFLKNWGFGEENCGNEIQITQKGDIVRSGNTVTAINKKYLLDVVGSYTVTLGGKKFDTICIMDIETYDSGVATEQFLDANGRTILWRRYNRDDWAFDRYQQKWSEKLPDNERLIINGKTYVHWYDCITDYIL